jgi:predicted ATPase/DNA-binding winged helix-turn-helix (wHTH) protein
MAASDSERLFPPFRLDPANAQLWRGQVQIGLRPKTFDVLRYLVDHPGQLVTKAMLLDAVWPGVSVSDSMPATCVAELRRALGDDPKTPKLIETVHSRGYRFIAQITGAETAEILLLTPPLPKACNAIVVGREQELAELQHCYAQVLKGYRRVVFVAGEAGIGKSTFAQTFIDAIAQESRPRIGHGQCIEQFGSGEPYMPVLEALSRLSRESGGERVIATLIKFAPTWLAQMPELLTHEERARLQSETQGVTQQRMLREMTQALGSLAEAEPLVLLLEDLQWSDVSTIELVSAIARRSEAARLLIIGTYRPVEILARDHPLRTVKQELQLHHYCEELRLRLLSTAEVQDYLARRLTTDAPRQFPTLAPVIHARTDGNPLFMVNMVDYLLLDTGLRLNSREVSEAELAEQLRMHRLESLSSIRHMIECNLERLRPEEQAVLEGASVAGAEFSAALVAAALERPQNEVEACCARLSRQEQFVTALGPITWPDGTVATGFRFHHALYQEVLYGRLSATERARFHQLIATRQEAAYGERAPEVATELANHYRRANLKLKAIQYFQLAGQRAISRAAVIEARGHFAEAIKLLHELPEGIARDRRELDLHLAIAPVLVAVIGGWYASETEQAWSRAQKLCDRLGDSAELFPLLFGMYALYIVRGKVDHANGLAKQLVSRADSVGDPAQMLYARTALGVTSYFIGDFTSALRSLEICTSIYDFERHRPLILHYGFDAGVWGLCYAAATYWQLGFADKALGKSQEALALARKQSHPLSLAQAELWTGILQQMRGEAPLVAEISDRLTTLATEHGLTDWLYWAACLHGWAIAIQGRYEEGIANIRDNQAALEARGLGVWRPYFLCLLADACLVANRVEFGLRVLKDGITSANESQERAHESQLYQLKGELLQRLPDPDLQGAQRSFEQAIKVAQAQGSRSLELRATTSLARLLLKQGYRTEARAILAGIYSWFNEGFDTFALREAKGLLDELSSK